jgi:hypothetical protein
MHATSPPLTWQRHRTRVRPMPQRPKNFRIARVEVTEAGPARVRTGPDAAAPARFTAAVQLAVPDLRVDVDILVTPGGLPTVQRLTVWASPTTALTSSSLRQVLLDPVVRAAVAAASGPTTERPDLMPGAFQVKGDPEGQAWVSAPAGADDRVRQVARLYNEALSAGSKAPALDVSETVHISRSQVARYIRKARDLGLIPPVGEVFRPVPAAAPQPPAGKPDPGPAIFRDPAAPWPGHPAGDER